MIRIAHAAAAIQPTLIRQVTDRARASSINLGLGQPDLGVSQAALAGAGDHLAQATALYSPNLGLLAARQAVASRYGIETEEVMLTCGVQEALAVAILGCVDPGERVLVPNPGFPAYDNLVRLAGAIPVPYTLRSADWQPDLDALAGLLPNARALILNTPSNPTGACISAENLSRIIAICDQSDVTWISDEIYEDFVYQGTHHSAREVSSRGLVLSGLSKSHGAMGWRIGWMTGPAATIEALKPLHQHLVTSAPVFAQHALIGALGSHDAQAARVLGIFEARRDVMCGLLDTIPMTSYVRPDGAFYVFLNVREHIQTSTLDLALQLLDERDVVTIPGDGFGPGGEGHLRLAFTRPVEELKVAVSRIAEHLG